jgi:hypothetical protein
MLYSWLQNAHVCGIASLYVRRRHGNDLSMEQGKTWCAPSFLIVVLSAFGSIYCMSLNVPCGWCATVHLCLYRKGTGGDRHDDNASLPFVVLLCFYLYDDCRCYGFKINPLPWWVPKTIHRCFQVPNDVLLTIVTLIDIFLWLCLNRHITLSEWFW